MTVYAFIQYLEYNWKAKSRHGIHSPFVYNFIDQVLLDKSVLKKEYPVTCPGLELKYENLLYRIAAYYNCRNIIYLPSAGIPRIPADMVLINTEPGKWDALLSEHLDLLKNESIVVITDIHKTMADNHAWRKLINQPAVRMSIDLFGIGLLFFKDEFKERQHFILKY